MGALTRALQRCLARRVPSLEQQLDAVIDDCKPRKVMALSHAEHRASAWRTRPCPKSNSSGFTELVVLTDAQPFVAFVHVYKCAGSFVEQILRQVCGSHDGCSAYCLSDHMGCGYESTSGTNVTRTSNPFQSIVSIRHSVEASAAHLGLHFPGLFNPNVTRWFAVVRNAFDRFESAISQLEFMCRTYAKPLPAHKSSRSQWYQRAWWFRTEASHCMFSCAEVLESIERLGWHDPHLAPMSSFLHDREGRKLPLRYIFTIDELDSGVHALVQEAIAAQGTITLHGQRSARDPQREHSAQQEDVSLVPVHTLSRVGRARCNTDERKRIAVLYADDRCQLPFLWSASTT